MKKQISEMERIKISTIVKKIESDDFEVDEVELLFIKLREYSQKNSIFEEIAHFIAHHDRDSGLIHSKLYQFYCRMRFFQEYQNVKNQKILDLHNPIKKYIYDFFLNETDATHSMEFKKKYGFSRNQAISKIKTSFEKQKDGMYQCPKSSDEMLINIIQLISSKITAKPITTLDKIVASMIQTLKENNLTFDEKKILRSKRLQLSVLTLLHKRKFYTTDGFLGYTYLTMLSNNFGKLQNINIFANVKMEDLNITFSIIETNFNQDIVDDSLIVEKKLDGGVTWESFDSEANIALSNKKLKKIKLDKEI